MAAGNAQSYLLPNQNGCVPSRIPSKRADHLVYFNPGDLEFPIGLNIIGSVAPICGEFQRAVPAGVPEPGVDPYVERRAGGV